MEKKQTKKTEKRLSVKMTETKFNISDGEFNIMAGLNDDTLAIATNRNDVHFVFKDVREKKTLKRWRSVLMLMLAACDLLEDQM